MWDGMDAGALDVTMAIFGRLATVYPMTPGAGPNAPRQIDPAREAIAAITVIRTEYSDRIETGDNGMGRAVGTFRQGAQGQRHIVTLPAGPASAARVGDELVYEDRPMIRYRLTEPHPDGGAGVAYILTRV